MIIVRTSIQFRVAAIVISLIFAVFGLISYYSLPLESFPEIVIPYIFVTSNYEGVSPSDMETLVTQHLEKKIKGITDIKEIRSSSAEGFAIISVEFNPDIDVDTALQKVRDKVDQAKQDLPQDLDDPEIQEVNFSQFPILYINLFGSANLVKLKQIAEDLQDKIEVIPGVLSAPIIGGLEREIRIEFDPERLAYYKLTFEEIILAIKSNNQNTPAGSIDINETKYLIKIPGEFVNPAEINNLVLLVKNGKPIYLTDIAQIRDTFKDRLSYSRLNSLDSITVGVQKRAGENLVKISDDVKKLLKEESQKFPEGVKYVLTSDQSKFIRMMVTDLKNNIITALILVLSVVFIALGARNAIFISIAIPLSMLMTFITLSLCDVTLNMVVLFSLILVSGMLVDNGIVLVENVYRHIQMGKKRVQATIDGASEVAWPVITSTLTTVAAFIPLMFWPGIIGNFMFFLPLTVIIALLASLFIALAINPPICSIMMPEKTKSRTVDGVINLKTLHPILKSYRWFLVKAINHPFIFVISCFISFFFVVFLFVKYNHGVEFFPISEPQRAYINIKASEGVTLDFSDSIVRKIEPLFSKYKEIENYISNVGGAGEEPLASGEKSNLSQIIIDFVDIRERKKKSSEIVEEFREKIKSSAGIEIVVNREEGGPPTGKPVNIEISGDKFEVLSGLSKRIKEKIKVVPGLADVKDDYTEGVPEIKVIIDREKSALLGLSTLEVAETVKTAVNGKKLSVLREGDKEFDITARLPESDRKNLEKVKNLLIPSRLGDPVPLSSVAQLVTRSGLGSIQRVNQKRTITITGNVKKNFNKDQVRKNVTNLLKNFPLPSGYTISMTGESKDQDEAQAFLSKAFLLAVLLVALIIVMQFNSIAFTVIIMSSVLLSLVGVLIGLLVTGKPFGIIMTGLGVISLAGVVVNNAIVLLDFVQKQRRKGLSVKDSLIFSGIARFRPVMLTAISAIFGLLPITLGVSYDFVNMRWDIGTESTQWWGPMAVAVVFGLFFATILTLVFVPSLYLVLWKIKHFILKILGFEKEQPSELISTETN